MDDAYTAVDEITNAPIPYAPNTSALTDIPVTFSTDLEPRFEQIIIQKGLAIYANGWKVW